MSTKKEVHKEKYSDPEHANHDQTDAEETVEIMDDTNDMTDTQETVEAENSVEDEVEVIDEDSITEEGTSDEEGTVDEVAMQELQRQLEEAEQNAEETQQKLLRTQADFDNYRRRMKQEKEEQAKYASLSLVEKLLPVVDNFERALAASEGHGESESLVKGVQMVFDQLNNALEEEGVEVIPTVGEAFDPHVHQAVMQVDSDEYESNVVVEEVQKGYQLKDKVVRPAMVKVSS